MISNTSKYAIRAVLFLALFSSPQKKVGLKRIAEELELPTPFLGKILQTLARQGLLSSTKGPNGGFSLRKAAMDIPLMEIVETIDGSDSFDQCMIRNSRCSQEAPCSLHEKISPYRKGMKSLMTGESVADLVSEFRQGRTGVRI